MSVIAFSQSTFSDTFELPKQVSFLAGGGIKGSIPKIGLLDIRVSKLLPTDCKEGNIYSIQYPTVVIDGVMQRRQSFGFSNLYIYGEVGLWGIFYNEVWSQKHKREVPQVFPLKNGWGIAGGVGISYAFLHYGELSGGIVYRMPLSNLERSDIPSVIVKGGVSFHIR